MKNENKTGIITYLKCAAVALAIGFGAGLYVGTKYNKDVSYAYAKAERKVYDLDRGMRKWTPRVAREALESFEDLQREALLDLKKEEAEQQIKEKLTELDEIIDKYESKK